MTIHFYYIQHNENGTVDVYVTTGAQLRVLRGLVPDDDLEEDIQERFNAYYSDAEVIPWPC